MQIYNSQSRRKETFVPLHRRQGRHLYVRPYGL